MAGVKGQRSGGHNRKTTKQLKDEGTYNKRRHGKRVDAKVDASSLPCPGDLTEHGAELWKRICQTLPREVVTKLDSDALRAYCRTWEIFRKLEQPMLDDPTDKDTRIAFFSTIDKLDKLGRQFGWTPQSRAGLQMPAKDESETDPMVEFLKRRQERN